MPRTWRMGLLHEWIHERRQNGTGTENEQRGQNKEHHDQWNEPPFLLCFEKNPEWYRFTWPGKIGQAWSALPQTVITVSTGCARNSFIDFERWFEISIPISFITWTAIGCTYPAGLEPALCTSRTWPATFLRI